MATIIDSARSSAGSVLPAPAATGPTWLDYQHPYYAANVARWRYARDHYTGAVLDKLPTYLVKKARGESQEAYDERCKLADLTLHFPQAVESLVGMLTAVEANANRVWMDKDSARGLGDPADPDSPIGRLWSRAGTGATGESVGYLTVWKELAIELVTCHFAWVMVDTVAGRPVLRVLDATRVPNWLDDLSCVVVREEVDTRGSIEHAPACAEQFLRLDLTGWRRYRRGEDGQPVPVIGPGSEGAYRFESPEGEPVLPIFPVALPMKRPIGYLQARKANAILNQESARDHLIRTANFPKQVLAADNVLFDQLVNDQAQGANVLQESPVNAGGGHRYIAPDSGPAQLAGTVLEEKVRYFHATFHRDFDQGAGAGREKTATEARQDVASGTGAFLQLLTAGVNDAENNALWRVEQIVRPSDRRWWYIARVERSEDFLPADPDAVMEKSAALAWGKEKAVPLGFRGQLEIAQQVAAQRGVTVDDAQLAAAVRVRAVLDVVESAPTTGIELPAEIRATLAVDVLTAAGYLEDGATITIEGDNGPEAAPAAQVIRQQALALAEAADEAKRRQAETLIGPPAPGAGVGGFGGASATGATSGE